MDKENRVMLQYSVQLDEVPEELRRQVEKANLLTHTHLTTKFKKLMATDTAELLQEGALMDIHRIRATLANIDIILSDVGNIIDGYISMSEEERPQEKTPEQESALEVVSDLNNILDTSDLEEKLNLFKEQQDIQDATKPTKNTSHQ